jgi:hypothetical protein
MGHANLKNISTVVNKMLHQRVCSITDIVDYLETHKIGVHASEGLLIDRCMLGFACEEVIGFLFAKGAITPVGMNRRQTKILKDWDTDASSNWDCGDDGCGGEYGVLDSIKWQAIKPRLPVLTNVSH